MQWGGSGNGLGIMNKALSVTLTLVVFSFFNSAFAGNRQFTSEPGSPTHSIQQIQMIGSEAYSGYGWVRAPANADVVSANRPQADRQVPNLLDQKGSNYRFELVGQPQQEGGIGKLHQADSESLIFVRLVRISDGALVADADVALLRVDMAPDAMGEMTARSYIRPYGALGTYRVEVHPSMAGRWAVTLAARTNDQSRLVPQVLTVALEK